MGRITRRDFLKTTGAVVALAVLGGCAGETGKAKRASAGLPRFAPPKDIRNKLVVASGPDVESKIEEALARLGGLEKFIHRGDKVVLKPNAAWARTPGQGATTDPKIVETMASLCKKAGASEVAILEHTIDRPAAMVLALCGMTEAAKKAGAKLISAGDKSMYGEIPISNGVILAKDQVARDVLDADVFINMPVAKVHAETILSLGMKNLMGIIWNRMAWHSSANVNQCIADFAGTVRPTLTILDATTMLLTNGPKGPGKTRRENKLVIGVDPVAVDAFGATLFGMDPKKIEHIALAHKIGAGHISLDALQVIRI